MRKFIYGGGVCEEVGEAMEALLGVNDRVHGNGLVSEQACVGREQYWVEEAFEFK